MISIKDLGTTIHPVIAIKDNDLLRVKSLLETRNIDYREEVGSYRMFLASEVGYLCKGKDVNMESLVEELANDSGLMESIDELIKSYIDEK